MALLPLRSWAALCIFLASEALLFKDVFIVKRYFYLFAWWAYILFIDGVIERQRGRSPIFSSPRCFLNLCIWSVSFWLFFELLNFRLSNWHYVAIEPNIFLRWMGYALSFATVLPGLFMTALFLDSLFKRGRFFDGKSVNGGQIGFERGPSLLVPFGLLFLILPMIWPRYLFPLVWGGVFLVFDPLNHLLGGRSIIVHCKAHGSRLVMVLLLSGLLCGFFWEFWNYWAESKWIYTIPYVGFWKIFEMPVLGFLGFPPFALECFAFYAFITLLGLGGWNHGAFVADAPQGERCRIFLPLVLSIPVWIICFRLIDSYTVISFSNW